MNMMKIGFRADGSSDLGLGHIKRCSALADFLSAEESYFWVRENPVVSSVLSGRKLSLLPADLAYQEEPAHLDSELRKLGIDLLVVDFLRYPAGYLEALKDRGFRLITFHEYEQQSPVSDLVINYNSFSGFESVEEGDSRCLGPTYTVLREGVRRLKGRDPARDVQDILVSMGGSDPNGIVFRVALALTNLSSNFRIIIHIGPAFKYRDRINEFLDLPNVSIADSVQELADLMTCVDLAVAAGGNTMYELCYLGIPSIIIAQNSHQHEFADGLAAAGAVRSLGLHSEITDADILEAVRQICDNFELRFSFSRRGRQLVDGRGCERIQEKIMVHVQDMGQS